MVARGRASPRLAGPASAEFLCVGHVVVFISLLLGGALATLLLAACLAPARLSPLAVRLAAEPQALVRDLGGRAVSVFDLPVDEARLLLLPVSQERSLPEGYRPPDLVWTFGRPVRSVIAPDLRAMIDAAAIDEVDLAVISGYRSPAEQAAAFEASVWRQLARERGAIDRGEAEARAARFVAPPGHSQHQLGTAVDLSSWELSYAINPRFAETPAGRWIARHAWAYGFVLPYTRPGESRTGYTYEPWHLRWIGRPLATLLDAAGYLDDPSLVADDYLRAVEELLDVEGAP